MSKESSYFRRLHKYFLLYFGWGVREGGSERASVKRLAREAAPGHALMKPSIRDSYYSHREEPNHLLCVWQEMLWMMFLLLLLLNIVYKYLTAGQIKVSTIHTLPGLINRQSWFLLSTKSERTVISFGWRSRQVWKCQDYNTRTLNNEGDYTEMDVTFCIIDVDLEIVEEWLRGLFYEGDEMLLPFNLQDSLRQNPLSVGRRWTSISPLARIYPRPNLISEVYTISSHAHEDPQL